MKYCIHSDGGGPFVLRVENYVMKRDFSEFPKGCPYRACFGIGLHSNQHIILKDCHLTSDLPIYMHNWNDQKGPCSMTIEHCELESTKEPVMEISLLGSGWRDFCVIHDTVFKGPGASILYKNMVLTDTANGHNVHWHGAGEMRLLGSGNDLNPTKIDDTEMEDDSSHRLSGQELAKQANAQ